KPSDLYAGIQHAVRSDIEIIPCDSRVQLSGTTEEIYRINPDDDALAERDMDRSTITYALDDAGVVLPGGNVTDNDQSLDISIGKAFDNVDDLAASLLPVEEGTSVPLSDVADIQQTQAEAESVSRTNGKDSITLLV